MNFFLFLIATAYRHLLRHSFGYFALLLLLSYNFSALFAQIRFEKGYFIDNDSSKTECLIKNVDWSYNPTEFEYKLQEKGEVQVAKIANVSEFGVYNFNKYIRAMVKIDKSSDNIARISDFRSPAFVDDMLFLKVLVEGAASLYEYQNRDINRFFYSLDQTNLEQLVFKLYQLDETTVGENREYQVQLYENTNCANQANNYFERINYNSIELVKHFILYNQCKGGNFVNMTIKPKRESFNLKIKPGVSLSSLSIGSSFANGGKAIDFSSAMSHRLSVELEFVLPFNKNKWSLFTDPAYQTYTSNTTAPSSGPIITTDSIDINFSNIEFPLGLKHYFYLSTNTKLSLQAAYVIDAMLKSHLQYDNNFALEPVLRPRMCFGASFSYKKLGVEARYYLNQNILTNASWWSAYKKMTFSLFYQLF
jgi:hypothetical protein